MAQPQEEITRIFSQEVFDQLDVLIEKFKTLKLETDAAYDSMYKLNAIWDKQRGFIDGAPEIKVNLPSSEE